MTGGDEDETRTVGLDGARRPHRHTADRLPRQRRIAVIAGREFDADRGQRLDGPAAKEAHAVERSIGRTRQHVGRDRSHDVGGEVFKPVDG